MITPVHNLQWSSVLQGIEPPPHRPPRERVPAPAADRGGDVSADLSPWAVFLSEEGLDFSTSSVQALELGMDFNLEFTSSSVERLSVSGYYSEETESLNLSWRFTFQQEVSVEGRTELRTFGADIQVNISQVNSKNVTTYARKEDIMSLLRRLFRDIEKIAADENKTLGSVVLDYKDFREIFALDNGKLAHDLMALIELTVILARLRQMLDSKKEVVVLAPEREETRGVTVTETSMRIESFHLEIRDVTSTLSAADNAGEIPASTTIGDTADLEPAAPTEEEIVSDSPPVP